MGTKLNIKKYIKKLVEQEVQKALCDLYYSAEPEPEPEPEPEVEDKDFYTVPEVARKVRLTADHIYRVTKSGELGSYKVGRKVFVSHEQLTGWLASKRQYTKLERNILADTYVATH